MPIGTDFSIDRSTGNIRHVANTTNYTVIALHRWLQDVADDASYSGNDELDITDATPSERSTDNIITLINGYNIDDDAAQYLYDGSIIQDDGDTIYDGILVYANAGMYLNIVQNGALATNFWTTGYNADSANGISHRFLLKVRTAGADIDGRRIRGTTREFGFTYSEFPVNGTSRGNNVMALTYTTDLNNQTVSGTVAGWTNITNASAGYNGIDVNNDTADEYFYSEWDRDTMTINQLYERMKYLTRRGEATTLYGVAGQLFRGITHEITVDAGSGTWSAFEAVSWSGGTGQLLARNNATATSCTKLWIQLLTGIPPVDNQVITGGTSGATNTMNVTITERTISQPFCGVSTGSALIGAYGFGVEAADLTSSDILFDLTNTSYSPPNFQTGTVAGLSITGDPDVVIVGPKGFWFYYDTEASGPFQVGETLTFASPAGTAILADLHDNGTTGKMFIGEMLTGSTPTDNSTIAGGTSLATASVDGEVDNFFNLRQLTLNGALTGAAVTSVVTATAIPSDTPTTGTIRIKRADGAYTKHPYSSWTGSTFTITSHDFSTNNAANGNQVWISYIDKTATATSESFTGVYSTARNMFVRVRNGGSAPIKTFETTASFGSGGFSVTASRISDL